MWVSTGNAGWPNPWDITTLAVLWPTEGSSSSLLISSGTLPLYLSINIFDKFQIPFDFVGERPTGLIISLISSIDNAPKKYGGEGALIIRLKKL